MSSSLDQNFEELRNFIRAYFGDFWEGRTETGVVNEVVQENPRDYLLEILELLAKFHTFNALPSEKREFLEQSGVYSETSEAAVLWIQHIATLLQQAIESTSPDPS